MDNLGDILNDDMEFTVVTAGNVIGKTKDLLSAYVVMFASYYIFNLAYPAKLNGTFMFIQKYILKIGDSLSIPPKLITLFGKLKAK